MIAAAGIEDQELAVIAERAGVDHPAVARGGNLCARTGRHSETLFAAADAVRRTELLDSHAIDGHRQSALGGREGDGRHHAARIAEGGEIGASFAGFVLAWASAATGGARPRFEPGDQVLEAVSLVAELRGALTFLVERPLALDLLLLAQ